jgi:hypothetical protein
MDDGRKFTQKAHWKLVRERCAGFETGFMKSYCLALGSDLKEECRVVHIM